MSEIYKEGSTTGSHRVGTEQTGPTNSDQSDFEAVFSMPVPQAHPTEVKRSAWAEEVAPRGTGRLPTISRPSPLPKQNESSVSTKDAPKTEPPKTAAPKPPEATIPPEEPTQSYFVPEQTSPQSPAKPSNDIEVPGSDESETVKVYRPDRPPQKAAEEAQAENHETEEGLLKQLNDSRQALAELSVKMRQSTWPSKDLKLEYSTALSAYSRSFAQFSKVAVRKLLDSDRDEAVIRQAFVDRVVGEQKKFNQAELQQIQKEPGEESGNKPGRTARSLGLPIRRKAAKSEKKSRKRSNAIMVRNRREAHDLRGQAVIVAVSSTADEIVTNTSLLPEGTIRKSVREDISKNRQKFMKKAGAVILVGAIGLGILSNMDRLRDGAGGGSEEGSNGSLNPGGGSDASNGDKIPAGPPTPEDIAGPPAPEIITFDVPENQGFIASIKAEHDLTDDQAFLAYKAMEPHLRGLPGTYLHGNHKEVRVSAPGDLPTNRDATIALQSYLRSIGASK